MGRMVTCAMRTTQEPTTTDAKTTSPGDDSMRDLIGKMGRAFVVALAAPVAMRDKAREMLLANDVAASLARDLDYANGERDEARETSDAAIKAHSALVHEIYKRDREIELKGRVLSTLADEVKIARGERDGYHADVQDLTARVEVANRSCVELKDEIDRARAERDDAARFRTKAEDEAKRLDDLLRSFAATSRDVDQKHKVRLANMTAERDACHVNKEELSVLLSATIRRAEKAEADAQRLTGILSDASTIEAELRGQVDTWRSKALALMPPMRGAFREESSAPTVLSEAGGVEDTGIERDS